MNISSFVLFISGLALQFLVPSFHALTSRSWQVYNEWWMVEHKAKCPRCFPQLLANRRMLRWFSADNVHNCGEDHQTCHVGYFSCIIMRGILCVLFQTFHPLLIILPRRCAVNRDWRMINLQQRHLCKQQIIFESNPCDQLLLLLLWSPKILILPGQLSAANMQHHSCAHWDWRLSLRCYLTFPVHAWWNSLNSFVRL